MQLYEMQVSKTAIYRTAPAKIPKGIIGAVVKLNFSPEWEGLTKTVVFRAGEVTKDVVDVTDMVVIPAECTQAEGEVLEMGVYGVDAENTVAIPTLWAAIGRITEGADPSGDETTDPSLPVWAQLQAQIRQLEEQGATQKEVEQVLEMVKQLEEQGVTQREIEQALRDFFGGERPTGKTTPEGGEIFNDYEDNQALAPYSKADGNGCRAGIYGYKLLAVAKSGESYNITVSDAKLDSKARDNYAAEDVLCFDGKGHYYERLKITGLTSNADGNTVITVETTDDGELSLLAVDSSKDEWENWIYCLDKPDVGVPVLAARGAYAGGVGNVAIGYGAVALGMDNKAVGKAAFTAGRGNTAYYMGYAKGLNNLVTGENASAEGQGNVSSGKNSHTDGLNNTASGNGSHAQNGRNVASGLYASASGVDNEASGQAADAGGAGTLASGNYAFTRGFHTEAGDIAAAFGRETRATGYGSLAAGRCTIAAGRHQHVHGKYNVEDAKGQYAHIVGGGTSDTDRKNIYTLDWDGNAEFAGKVYSGGVEVAPGGFGLGGSVTILDDYDWNTCTATGWYAAKINAPEDNIWYFGEVIRMGNGQILQKVSRQFSAIDDSPYFLNAERRGFSADSGVTWSWSEWEWVNPRMIPGVEYRTTKRWESKPVYQKLVYFGALPNGSGASATANREVEIAVADSTVISLTGYASKAGEFNPMPIGVSGELGAYAYIAGTKLGVTSVKQLSDYTAYFLVEYVAG